jgi:RNA polymerase sigma-B factor
MPKLNGGDSDRPLARDADAAERAQLIEGYLPLVRRIAARFAGRDEPLDDLVQVGSLALVKAVDRRDPARSSLLTAYVARCVEGEIRRHLRDRCEVVRVPRGLQALRPVARPWDETDAERVATPEGGDGATLARVLVRRAARSLERHERRVLLLRYFLDLSQAEVGAVEGVSQVQVSRVQRRAIAKLRARLVPDEPPPGSPAGGSALRSRP